MASALSGRRVVVTRSRRQGEEFCRKLLEKGARPLLFPTIKTVALHSVAIESAVKGISTYDWIVFSSANAVDFLFQLAPTQTNLPRTAAIGSATTAALRRRGIEPEFTPRAFTADALVDGLGARPGQSVLIPHSRIGRPELAAGLRGQGATVDDVPFYDTVGDRPTPKEVDDLAQGADALTFASPSSVVNFLAILAEFEAETTCADLQHVVSSSIIACIGPTTADSATSHGFDVDIVATRHTVDGLIEALETHFFRR